MSCPLQNLENAQLLLDYCTRKLAPESAAALERHIAVCGACEEFARGQRTVWQALDAWEAAPVSRDFDSRLYRRIEAQVSWWDLLLRPFRLPGKSSLRRGLPAAAMACLLVMVGVILERPAVSPLPPPNDMAQVESVQPEQVERTLETMEILNEFSHHVRNDVRNDVRTDSPDSKL